MKYQRFHGRFQNVLILRTFAAHLKAVDGTQWVDGLTFDLDEHPRTTLALATSAVSFVLHLVEYILTILKAECALQLWAEGTIMVQSVCDAQAVETLKIKLNTVVNNQGIEMARHAAFSFVEVCTRT